METKANESIRRVVNEATKPDAYYDIVQAALSNTKTNLPPDVVEEYMYALANYCCYIQTEINKAQAEISYINQKLRSCVKKPDYSIYNAEERLLNSIAKNPDAMELYKRRQALEREVLATQYIINVIKEKRQSYAKIYDNRRPMQ